MFFLNNILQPKYHMLNVNFFPPSLRKLRVVACLRKLNESSCDFSKQVVTRPWPSWFLVCSLSQISLILLKRQLFSAMIRSDKIQAGQVFKYRFLFLNLFPLPSLIPSFKKVKFFLKRQSNNSSEFNSTDAYKCHVVNFVSLTLQL